MLRSGLRLRRPRRGVRPELAAFADAVRGGTPAPVGGEDARAALEIALAAAASVAGGKPVRIDEVGK